MDDSLDDLFSEPMDMSDDGIPSASPIVLQSTESKDVQPNDHSSQHADDSDDNSDEDGPIFEVETILAQRKVSGTLEYLVKWAGYDLMNCTWEPKDSFDTDETLQDWQKKKLDINCGNWPRFNVNKWEKEKSKIEDEFNAAGKDLEEHNSELHTNMQEYEFPLLTTELPVEPPIEDPNLPVAETTAHGVSSEQDATTDENPFVLPFPRYGPFGSRLSIASDVSSSLFVTPEPTGSRKEGFPTRPLLSMGRTPVASTTPIEVPQSSVAESAPRERRQQQASLQQPKPRPVTHQPSAPNPSIRKPAPSMPPIVVPSRVGFGQSARPKFARKRGYESAWGRDRAPPPDEIELMKPSEFSQRENYGHAVPNLPGSKPPSATAQPPPEKPRAVEASGSISAPRVPSVPGPSTIATGPRSMNPAPPAGQSPQLSSGEISRIEPAAYPPPRSTERHNSLSELHRSSQLPSFNRRPSSPDVENRQRAHDHTRRPSPSVYSRRFSDSGDAAPAAPPVLSEKDQISRMPVGKPQKGVRFWQKRYFNNPGEVFGYVYFGASKTYIGPVRLVGQTPRASYDLLQSGVSKDSRFELWFKELYTYSEFCEGDERGSKIWCNSWMEGFEDSNQELFRMAKYLRKERMAAVYRPRNSFGNNWIAYTPESRFDNLLSLSGQSSFPDNVAVRLAIHTPLHLPRVRELRPPSDEFLYAIESQSTSSGSKSHLDKAKEPPISDGLQFQPDLDQFSPSDGQSISDSTTRPSDIAVQPRPPSELITNALPTTHTRPSEIAVQPQPPSELITNTLPTTHAKLLSQLASTFPTGPHQRPIYLHFPFEDEVSEDFNFMSTWLSFLNMQFLSNRDNNGNESNSGWMEFCTTHKNGIVVFHESFYDFASMRPPLRHSQRNPNVDFWSIRLKRPLDFPDLRHCDEGSHIQRLFPHGSAILVTEDLLQDIKELAVIVYWFYKKCSRAKRPGIDKLVFWPDILGYLDKKLADPARNKEDDPFVLCIIAYIKHINSAFDPLSPHFDISSMDIQNFDGPNNNVVCLPIQDYGRRQERDTPHLPKHLTQHERDADHLVEAFSGWTLLNASCFRKTMVISNHNNERLLHHWTSRGHVTVYDSKLFFESLQLGTDFKADALQVLQNGPNRDGESPISLAERTATPRAPQTPNTPLESQNPGGTRDPAISTRGPRVSQRSRWAVPSAHGSRHPLGYQ